MKARLAPKMRSVCAVSVALAATLSTATGLAHPAFASTLENELTNDAFVRSDVFSRRNGLSIGNAGLDDLQGLLLPSETEDRLQEMVDAAPHDAGPLKVLAVYYTRIGRLQDALRALEKALTLEPENTELALDVIKLIASTDGVSAARDRLRAFGTNARDPFQFDLAYVQLEHDRGDRQRAREKLQTMITDEASVSRSNSMRLLLARYLIDDGKTDEARTQVDTVLLQVPTHADALAFRALYRLNDLDIAGARADIATGLQADPSNVALLRLSARAEWRAGNKQEATNHLLRAAVLSDYQPDITREAVAVLQDAGRTNDALDMLRKAVDRHPDAPELVAQLGVFLLASKDWEGAERAATALRQFGSPRAVEDSEKMRVAILRGRGREVEAQALLEQIGANGSDIGAIAGVVNDHLSRNDPDGAMNYIEDLLAKYPNTPAFMLMRASLNEMQGDAETAQSDYQAVIKSVPQSPIAYVSLARHQMRNDRGTEAEATLRAGLRERPGDPVLQMPLVEILVRENEIAEALGLMEEMVKTYPDNLLVANNYVALVTDYAPEDPDALKRAASVAGQLGASPVPKLRDTYGWLLHKQGDHIEARDVLRSVLEDIPDDPWANYHYGMVLAELGQRDAALTHLRRALASTDATFDRSDVALAKIETLSSQ